MNNIIKFYYVQRNFQGDFLMNDIKKERMLEIEEIVNGLLSGINFEKSPYVDIVSLVKKDNFEVKTETMDIDTTGYLVVNDNAEKLERNITVNTIFKNPDNETDVIFKKSRFITAHEYGHFILHKKSEDPLYAHRDSDHRTEPMELEADYFARAILMPLEQFKLYNTVLNDFSNMDNEFVNKILSRLFRVTKNKIEKRKEDLLVLN